MTMDLGQFSSIALSFVIIAVVIGVTGTILSGVLSQQCTSGTAGYNSTTGACLAGSTTVASNATTQGLTGLGTFGSWLPTIAVVVAAAVVIGVIIAYFRQ
jgi:hypothetical protein